MTIFGILRDDLLALSMLFGVGVLVFAGLSIPFMVWVEGSRAVLRPLLSQMPPSRRPIQFGFADVFCLLAELSLFGMLTTRIAAHPPHRRLAVALLVMLSLLTFLSWRCSLSWLTRTNVQGKARRAVFQIFVVPTALFFPFIFLFLFLWCANLLVAGAPHLWDALLPATLIAIIATALLMRSGFWLANWVSLERYGKKSGIALR